MWSLCLVSGPCISWGHTLIDDSQKLSARHDHGYKVQATAQSSGTIRDVKTRNLGSSTCSHSECKHGRDQMEAMAQ